MFFIPFAALGILIALVGVCVYWLAHFILGDK
jgi:hypothetical protein